jgi:hypothetical protein
MVSIGRTDILINIILHQRLLQAESIGIFHSTQKYYSYHARFCFQNAPFDLKYKMADLSMDKKRPEDKIPIAE